MNQYKISDISLAATLLTLNYKMAGVEMEDSSRIRVAFCFNRDKNIEQDIGSYGQDRLVVNPRVLLDNLKHLKITASEYRKNN